MFNNEMLNDAELKKRKIESILSSVHNLPSIPMIMMEVSRLIEEPGASATKLGKMISKDQGLVTKILSVANSPLYGIPRRVSTIDFAIVILGFNHIKNIVIALSMMEAFKSVTGTHFDQKRYWEHSFMIATAAKKIADDLGYRTSGEVFTAGLLHDLGIPIIFKYFNKEYLQIINQVELTGRSYYSLENEILGLTHSDIAKYLMDKWNLPINLTEAIQYHHTPSMCPTDPIVASLIHLADHMTQKFEVGNFDWDKGIAFDSNIIDILKIGNEEYLEKFIYSYKELFENQIESLNF